MLVHNPNFLGVDSVSVQNKNEVYPQKLQLRTGGLPFSNTPKSQSPYFMVINMVKSTSAGKAEQKPNFLLVAWFIKYDAEIYRLSFWNPDFWSWFPELL